MTYTCLPCLSYKTICMNALVTWQTVEKEAEEVLEEILRRID
jgi:hypothetical protein